MSTVYLDVNMKKVLPLLAPAERRGVEAHFGVWAVDDRVAGLTAGALRTLDLGAHVAEQRRARAAAPLPDGKSPRPAVEFGAVPAENVGAVRLLHLVGELTKYGSSVLDGVSTLHAREELRAAARDPLVEGIVLLFDSPGGTVAGVGDLADEVYRLRGRKPIVAFCEDMCASAAYWVASQCTKVVVNPSGFVGGIGVYVAVEDTSALAEAAGVRVTVVKSGAYKGALTPGAPVDGAALAEVQRQVDAVNELFIGAVARGRGMSAERVRALATGELYVARAALKLGLVDEVGDLERAVELAGGEPGDGGAAKKTGPSVYQTWREAVRAEQARGLTYQQAVKAVDKARPGLRDFMLREVGLKWPRPSS